MDNDLQRHRIPIGISSCLLGERVRYDGGHKGHSYITRRLGEYFEFKPFCPELDIGLGVPRKPIRLLRQTDNSIRCVQTDDSSRDYTEALTGSADKQKHWQQTLCGYIFKKDSPSCGMERVKIWDSTAPKREGVGMYARRVMENFPFLPVEEEGRLGNAYLRENFIRRVYALRRWYELEAQGLTVSGLMGFHVRHKLILMSHDQETYADLGRLVAKSNRENLSDIARRYLQEFMVAMKKRASRKHPVDYISQSYYMNPYPEELCLRNEI